MLDMKEKMVELLDDIQLRGEDFTDYEIYGMRLPDTISNEDVASHLIANGVTVQECGHWKIIMDDYDCEMMCCSVCGSEFYDGDNDTVDCLHNYCPHCGAKMLPQPPKGE